MALLVLGLLLFLGAHALPLFAPAWKDGVVARHGEKIWKGLFSLVSLAGLVLIALGYGQSRQDPTVLWQPPLWAAHLALPLTLLAFILLLAPYVPRNHLKSKLGHPMYAGVKLWAFAHLLANGRLSDLLLFGSFLLWAVAGFALSRRRDRAAGRSYPPGTVGGTLLTVVAGALLWAVFAMWLHRWLIGVAPLVT